MISGHAAEQAIAADLAACDLALAMLRGKSRRPYLAQRHRCYAQIAAWNVEDGLREMSDDELLAELAK